MWTKENIPDQAGKTAIVTGANSGIGFETALALYEAGAHVIVACRNISNAETAIKKLERSGETGILEPGIIDLSKLDSVKRFVREFLGSHDKLDLLINNAGLMIPPPSKTAEGFEIQFGTNFLGHFALTGLLYPLLRNSRNSRVVTLTSLAYTSGAIDFDNLRLEKEYDAGREYSQSKLADLLFTVAFQEKINLAGDYVLSLAAHPGVTQSGLARNMSKDAYDEAISKFGELMPASQGALPSLFAATSAESEPGGFYGPDRDGGLRGFPVKTVIKENALDEIIANKLWALAENVTGVRFPFI